MLSNVISQYGVLILLGAVAFFLLRSGSVSLPKLGAKPESLKLRDTLRSIFDELRASDELRDLLRALVTKSQDQKEKKE